MSSKAADLAAGAAKSPGARALEPRGLDGPSAALNVAWAGRFAASLAAAGVRDAVIAPGSRSAPLTLALHAAGLRLHVALDERAGAFFALGAAKAARRPAAVVTTSGTAAANLLPAVVEAHQARVPLVLLTADRPPELRDTGAPQSIDQLKLFGGFVRWFCEVGAPSPGTELLEYAASLGARAAAEAWRAPPGPVHLNFAFREPLLPEPETMPEAATPTGGAPRAEDAAGPDPAPPSLRTISRWTQTLRARRRGLIVCGPEDAGEGFAEAIARLSAATGYPVLADAASQVRYGPHDRSRILGAYDAFLRAPRFSEGEAPEIALQFGPPLTSKAYHLYAARHADTLHLLVDPGGAPRHQARRAREVLTADPTLTATALADSLAGAGDPLPSWLERFREADAAARETLGSAVREGEAPVEGALFAALVPALPDGSLLYVGNSMPVRDLDAFAPEGRRRIRVLVNRGANGIDGVVSCALGAGATTDAPVVCVTGDLSFHHDLNALHLSREAGGRAALVLLHNDGGGIFSFLPVARHGQVFERFFGTPHGLDFEPVAVLYGVPFLRARDPAEAARNAVGSADARETAVVELRSERGKSRAAHQRVAEAVVRAVEGLA
jgi:2-succinyl-5-enolpyruvyl-6-hydroxy-3-cyclohexene-1-carboxylate synthase